MIKICVECETVFEMNTNTFTCSDKCKMNRWSIKRKEFPSRKRKSLDIPVSKDYCEGEKVEVHRDVRENNEKVKHKEIAKVIKVYPYHLSCEINLKHRKCIESFKFDEVRKI